MSRTRYSRKTLLRWLPTILPIFLFIGVGFAAFSSDLSVESKVTVKTDKEHLETGNGQLEFNISTWGNSPITYSLNPATIRNTSSESYIGWKVTFTVPPDASSVTCWSATCEIVNGKMLLEGLSYNSVIPSDGTTSFGITFNSNISDFKILDVVVVGVHESEPEPEPEPEPEDSNNPTPSDGYVGIPGLSATVTAGTGWGPNDKYTRQFTIILTNNSGQAVPSWRIDFNWNTSINSVSSAWGANYEIVNGNKLRFYGTNLSNGQSVNIGGNLTGPSTNWTLSTPLVKAKI